MPIAIDRYTVAAMTPAADRIVHVRSQALNRTVSFDLDEPFERRGDWSDYVAGMAAAVDEQARLESGCSMSIGGDLPIGAGLSSSASLELAVGLAFFDLARVRPEPRRLAAAGARAEQEFVGVRSGVMDQLICALGRPECALLIDCRSLEARAVRLPSHLAVAVCDTGVKHALASSAYNDRRAGCEQGVRILREHGLSIQALRDVTVAQFEQAGQVLPSPIRERCRHVVEENQRTLDAVLAIERGDLAALGDLLNASHRSLRDLYEVSSPELDRVAGIAQSVPGVYGARMTGGGFGGAAVAVLQPQAFPALHRALEREYYRPAGIAPAAFLVRAVGGAAELTA